MRFKDGLAFVVCKFIALKLAVRIMTTTAAWPKIQDTTWQMTQKKLLCVSFCLTVKQTGFLKITHALKLFWTYSEAEFWCSIAVVYQQLPLWPLGQRKLPEIVFDNCLSFSNKHTDIDGDGNCHMTAVMLENLITTDQFLPATHEQFGNETRIFISHDSPAPQSYCYQQPHSSSLN